MARITVEDCLPKVNGDRFGLVVLAAQRAKELALGAQPMLPVDNDKYPVVALREVAEGLLSVDQLKESVIKHHQRRQLLGSEDTFEVVDEEVESAYQKGMASFSAPSKKKSDSSDDDSDDDSID